MVMSEDELLLSHGRLMQDYTRAKAELEALRAQAASEAKVIALLVEYLKTGGRSGSPSTGRPASDYFSDRVAGIVDKLQLAIQEHDDLKRRLRGLGLPLSD